MTIGMCLMKLTSMMIGKSVHNNLKKQRENLNNGE